MATPPQPVQVFVEKGMIYCDPPVLKVSRAQSGRSTVLTFKLMTQGYSFPSHGGVIILGEAFPSVCSTPQTPNPLPTNVSEVHLTDINLRDQDYFYQVTVHETSSGNHIQTLADDPIIRNGQ